MNDRTSLQQTSTPRSTGTVHWGFAMSLDGFVAGPGHSMEFLNGATVEEGFIEEAIASTGAVLAGRAGYDSAIGDSRPYGGAWKGPIFVLTHHPEDARPAEDITFLSCAVEEAVRIGLAAAGGKKLGIFSPSIGRQLLGLGLIDEIDIHIVPVLLGDGIRLYDAPGGDLLRLLRRGADPTRAVRLQYVPTGRDAS
jgi:dihydrofolate reductase